MNPRLGPRAQAEYLSQQKAKAVSERVKHAIIIAADTLVVLNKEIIGKPSSVEQAKKMLKKLSGKTHTVITGFTIIDTASNKTTTKSSQTKVFIRKLSKKEIDAYVKKEQTLDKAGGYAIQGIGSLLIEKIEGDFSNVVGLPLATLYQELKKFGIFLL